MNLSTNTIHAVGLTNTERIENMKFAECALPRNANYNPGRLQKLIFEFDESGFSCARVEFEEGDARQHRCVAGNLNHAIKVCKKDGTLYAFSRGGVTYIARKDV